MASRGLREGLEKSLGWIMPLFLGIIVLLVIQSLMLPGAIEAIRYLFYPNFTKFSASTLSQVIGHVFFSLSVGMGTIAVFGSYLKEESPLTSTSFRMVILDTTTSLFVSLLIFPVVFSMNHLSGSGPQLLFKTMPFLFQQFTYSNILGFVFFVCLYIAALASSISLLESSVSNLVDRYKFSRKKATLQMGFVAFGFAILPALSSNVLNQIKIAGMSILIFFDTIVVNWVLPISVIGISLAVGFGMKNEIKRVLFVNPNLPESIPLFRDWSFLVRWFVPVFILVAVLMNVINVLEKI
jgi:NSS family neurotransmitter:Na+ symporter